MKPYLKQNDYEYTMYLNELTLQLQIYLPTFLKQV